MKADYEKHLGKFLDGQGRIIDAPPPNVPFVVLAAPWEEMGGKRGAMQAKCAACTRLIGIAPPTQTMIDAGRPMIVLCRECFYELDEIRKTHDDGI
jgi:hypothetical protein